MNSWLIIRRVASQFFLFLFASFLVAYGCGGGGGGDGDGGNGVVQDESSLLVSMPAVAVVPGGVEMITVEATDENGDPVTCDVTCSDETVASIVHTGGVIEVTGEDYGTATLTVTSATGLEKDIPVQVYNHRLIDAGELLISFTDKFKYRWRDSASGGRYDGNFWHPVPEAGWYALGSLGFGGTRGFGYHNPNGVYSMIVVKESSDANPNLPPLKHPLSYDKIWDDRDTHATDSGSFWTPVCPLGYKAMGVVAQGGWSSPSINDVVCVREDLTIPGEAADLVWNDADTGGTYGSFGSWLIQNKADKPHELAHLEAGTFVGWNRHQRPETHDTMNLLKVRLPMLAEAPVQSYVPRLESYDTPPHETVPLMAKVMLMPYTMVKDQDYFDEWRWEESPFYRLERYVYYKLLYHNHNQTNVQQDNSVEIVSGVSTTESDSFWEETSVSITAEAGINFKAASAKISATVSRSFGYETMSSVTELQEKHVTSTVSTPPNSAAALWQQLNRYVLKRHNGTNVETVYEWEFGIDSYTTSMYPPAN